jgi:periplasmic protein TonB
MRRFLSFGGSAALHVGVVGTVFLAGSLGAFWEPARTSIAAPPPVPMSLDVHRDPPRETPAFEVSVPLPAPLAPEDVELPVDPAEPALEEPPAPRIAPDLPAPRLDRPLTTSAPAPRPMETAAAPVPDVETEIAPLEIQNPTPSYPAAARRRRLEGYVLLELLVRADGSVGDPRVVESAGSPLFVDEVLRVVSGWRYRPASIGGVPVDRHQQVRFVFRLE